MYVGQIKTFADYLSYSLFNQQLYLLKNKSETWNLTYQNKLKKTIPTFRQKSSVLV